MDTESTNIDRVELDPKCFTPRELYMLISQVREIIVQRLDLAEKARLLQATEYERRLEILNHSHEMIRGKEESFLSKEHYDIQHQELERRVEVNNLTIVGMSGLASRIDSLNLWREEASKVHNMFTTATLPTVQAQHVELSALRDRVTLLDRRIVSIYSYGAGAAAVLMLIGVLINVVIRLAFKS